MTVTQQAEVALPPGADPENIDNWEADNGTASRLVWSTPMPLPEGLAIDVRIVASQRPDGSIMVDDIEGPLVYVGGDDYTIAEVRHLIQALTTAADLANQWAGADK